MRRGHAGPARSPGRLLLFGFLVLTLPAPCRAQGSANDGEVLSGKLLKAVGDGDAAAVERLIAAGAGISGDAFMAAFGNGHPEIARLLVELGGDPDAVGSFGMPALALFTNDKDVEKLRLLLELGSDPNQRIGAGGVTPLMMAAIQNEVEAAKALLEAGADPAVESADGESAMDWAAAVGLLSGDSQMAEMLADGSPEGQKLLSKIKGGYDVDGTRQEGAQTLSKDRSTYVAGKFTGPCVARRSPRFDPAKPKPGDSGSGAYRETHVSFEGGQKVGMITPPDCTPLDLMPARYEVTILGGDLSWVWQCEEARGGKCPILVRKENNTSANERFGIGVEPAPAKEDERPDPPCRVESVEITTPIGGEQVAFDRSPTGFLKLTAHADVEPSECGKALEWSIEDIGSVTALVQPGGAAGADGVVFSYRGLPDRNHDFGPTTITARAGGRMDTVSVDVFYSPTGYNHGGSGSQPNWMYYWDQTRAGTGEILKYTAERFSETVPGQRVQGQYDFGEDVVYLTDRAFESSCAARTQGYGTGESKGIDCFAELVRHEGQHKKERHAWWGTFNPKAAFDSDREAYMDRYDQDGDLVPDSVEKHLEQSRGCDYDSRESCSGRPPGKIDLEMNAYGVGWSWIRGAANDQDWSWCGKQWKDVQVCPGKRVW